MLIGVDDAVQLSGRSRVIAVDGARCSGKNYLISKIRDKWGHREYEYLAPRKRWVTDSSGSMNNLPEGLDPAQSTLWVLDFLSQNPDLKVVMNRCIFSSMCYEGMKPSLLEVWVRMMKSVGGVVFFLTPDEKVHRERIMKCGRGSEVVSILLERAKLLNVLGSVPESVLPKGMIVFVK